MSFTRGSCSWALRIIPAEPSRLPSLTRMSSHVSPVASSDDVIRRTSSGRFSSSLKMGTTVEIMLSARRARASYRRAPAQSRIGLMRRIVLTGGPGAGKTVIAHRIAGEHSDRFVLVPEAATQVYDALRTRWDLLTVRP